MRKKIELPPWQNDSSVTKDLVKAEPVEDDVAVVVRALEAGLPRSFACHLAGRSMAWYRQKRHDDPNFEILTDKAIARGVEQRVTRINRHAKRQWQADAWMLARTHPKEFAEPAVALRTEISVDSRPTNIVLIGPERAAILATRHESIRARTRELLAERTNGNGNGDSQGNGTVH